MATISFQDMAFTKEEKGLNVMLYKLYTFTIPEDELESMGSYAVEDAHTLNFPGMKQEKAERRFSQLIAKHIPDLRLAMNNVPARYIHQASGIPLMGTNYFGLVDRDTNIIELKPMTGCNLNCIYCSVDEGRRSSKVQNYIIEEEYLVEEFKKIVALKECDQIEAHIGGQADPSLYARLPELISDLQAIEEVKTISIDTNGVLLSGNRSYLDEILDAGLTRMNLSLNALDPEMAKRMAGTPYPVERVKALAAYVLSRIDLIIAPTLLPGVNEEEMPKIIEFAKSISTPKREAKVRIQNFLRYPHGRNPVKPKDFEWFFSRLRQWERQHEVKLTMMDDDSFVFLKTRKIPKPMKKDEVVQVELLMPGRRRGEMLGKARGRMVSLPGCRKLRGTVRARITRSKHNIFTAKV
ncbi:MAG: radical SAM protein [DPANN group archaeon]|nr:radical SAM protein [DPANN group archaeon]